ncbi:MAG: adenosylcobalamin-dependent ribonucleoside-diphosphate reductase [Bacteroidota bacterium]|nr:adenosylcobalamin-dependent ribonucleoside-diphosphate reductase [Bacteroidota bacterium]
MNRLNKNAIKVLESRYLLKNNEGKIIETPEQLFERVAKHIAKAELIYGDMQSALKWEKIFFDMMAQLYFLPNSPTLMNAGLPLNQLSACFVLPIEDSIEGIFTSLKNTALIQQSGGGTGFNFSRLRQKGDFVHSTSGISSGPIAFMKIFDAATNNIKQGGKRRGANMGILNIDHPDIEEFISIKLEEGTLSNFNISVGIYDSFMKAVEENKPWQLKHPNTGKVIKTIPAQQLWNKITHCAWQSGDPGLIFLDTINASNPTPSIGDIISTNPCGEVPLLAFEACNLGSIDVAKLIDPKKREFDWDQFSKIIINSIRFLDNVIDMNNYLIPEITTIVKGNRKIGLGIMGWADLLIKMEIPYASENALQFAEKLMQFMKEKCDRASQDLAKERGVFKNWGESIFSPHHTMRNATRSSIAPTGTISIVAGTSSSIEPIFALAIHRENVLNNESLFEINENFITYLKDHNLYSEEVINEVKKNGTISQTKLPQNVKELFKTSLEIEPYWHIMHQVAFQKYTDNAVSKTINLPESATEKEVNDAYLLAWKEKAKGVTVFRYGSKTNQVLTRGVSENENQGSCKVCFT